MVLLCAYLRRLSSQITRCVFSDNFAYDVLIKLKFIIPGNIDPLCCIQYHPNSTFVYSHHHPNCPVLDGWLSLMKLPFSGQRLVQQRQRPENPLPTDSHKVKCALLARLLTWDILFSSSLTWGSQEETGWKRFCSGEIGQENPWMWKDFKSSPAPPLPIIVHAETGCTPAGRRGQSRTKVDRKAAWSLLDAPAWETSPRG